MKGLKWAVETSFKGFMETLRLIYDPAIQPQWLYSQRKRAREREREGEREKEREKERERRGERKRIYKKESLLYRHSSYTERERKRLREGGWCKDKIAFCKRKK